MGRTETYGDEDEKTKHQKIFVQTSSGSKKLFRNKDDKYIAGMCMGSLFTQVFMYFWCAY
ncbi:PspC domain-containing protein [Bacteroidetes bacterium endosymbiont of Geopemphigus sp.]|uniref:PspC domain-containing protein n=1 Tax=Bacteroidetes bacterium endosymbiont of Geopemphigus sp. TaxID=2047937 RepID=UPI0011AEC487|nr:PspC domain-containing protein [Bacteroidetes bacterium endosymbiont of Geopemphigus sp.]